MVVFTLKVVGMSYKSAMTISDILTEDEFQTPYRRCKIKSNNNIYPGKQTMKPELFYRQIPD